MDEEGCFTLTWEIENVDIFLRAEGGMLVSPAWKTVTTSGIAVWWFLCVFHDSSKLGIKLLYLNKFWRPFKCEISFISSRGEIVRKHPTSYRANSVIFCVENDFLKSSHVHSIIDSQNTLTLDCKMTKKAVKSGGFRIHSVVQKFNLGWNKKDLRSCDSLPYSYNSTIERNNLLIDIKLLKNHLNEYYVCAVLLPILDGCFSFVDCKTVRDGQMTETNFIEKVEKYNYLRTECTINVPDASSKLNLHLECILAYHNDCQNQMICPTSSRIAKEESIAKAVIGPLNNDLLHLYTESILSDATLNTEGKSFSVHRSILAARSPVFRGMFEKDEMSEGRSGVVDVDDVDSETVDRMLVVLYGGSLEGVQWEEASTLYYAADKYAVLPLKQKCADILKVGLSLSNACDALVLADRHSDEQLMKCAVDFIYDHQEVVSSPEWVKLEDSQPRLTSKVAKELFLKKGKK